MYTIPARLPIVARPRPRRAFPPSSLDRFLPPVVVGAATAAAVGTGLSLDELIWNASRPERAFAAPYRSRRCHSGCARRISVLEGKHALQRVPGVAHVHLRRSTWGRCRESIRRLPERLARGRAECPGIYNSTAKTTAADAAILNLLGRAAI